MSFNFDHSSGQLFAASIQPHLAKKDTDRTLPILSVLSFEFSAPGGVSAKANAQGREAILLLALFGILGVLLWQYPQLSQVTSSPMNHPTNLLEKK